MSAGLGISIKNNENAFGADIRTGWASASKKASLLGAETVTDKELG